MQANTYGEVLHMTKHAHVKLKRLGCFKRVDGFLDVAKDNLAEGK